jgi:hypothetical protein
VRHSGRRDVQSENSIPTERSEPHLTTSNQPRQAHVDKEGTTLEAVCVSPAQSCKTIKFNSIFIKSIIFNCVLY